MAALAICSCSGEKQYTIDGVLNIPSQIPYGDTVIDLPSCEGSMVYLMEEDNVIDSCEVVDNRFTFTGTVKPSESYFAQINGMFVSALIVVEPGEISFYSDGMSTTISGTPSNHGLNDVTFQMTSLQEELSQRFQAFEDSLTAIGEEISIEHYSALSQIASEREHQVLDSLYEVNADNLSAAYIAVLRHVEDGSADGLEKGLAEYPEHIRNNSFVQSCLRALRAQEQAAMNEQFLDDSMYADPEEGEE